MLHTNDTDKGKNIAPQSFPGASILKNQMSLKRWGQSYQIDLDDKHQVNKNNQSWGIKVSITACKF